MFNSITPYNNLPLLPPPNTDIETKEILKECIKARAALAELKQAGRLIPNQSILINSIPLLEAQSSSEIENIVTTQDKLFRFANDNIDKADLTTKETLYYRTALYKGCELLKRKPLCTSSAIEIMQILRQTSEVIRKMPGTALINSKTGGVIYTPPCGENVIREKLGNWEKFINTSNEIDPLIILSIIHYQFEAIHPFSDANGRTGRILNILFLIQENLLETPVLFLSRFINNTRNEYYSKLHNVTLKNEWEEWILYMLKGIYETSVWTKNKIDEINLLFNDIKAVVQIKLPKIYSRELIEVLFEQPYCRIRNIENANIAKRQTASVYLKELVNTGILEEKDIGKEKIFINKKLYRLLSQK